MAEFGQSRGTLGYGQAQAADIDVGLRAYMLRIYNYMAAGLAVTGAVAMLVASNQALMQTIFGSPLKWVVMLAPIGMLLIVSFAQDKLSTGALKAFYWVFTLVFGMSMAAVFYRYTGASVARTFFITAAAFAALSAYGYTTKRDLTGFGKFLFMGLIGLMLASIVQLFFPTGMLQFAIAVIGVLIFSGLIAYETQSLKNMYVEVAGTELEQRVTIMGAWSLYLDFVNLFQFLLQLTGVTRDE
ncbi:MAG: Bax inhibitor-1/YccA family protein [Alphaproteobacteria bacterium]|nr:Bax inhibitor-1/YccA family protein [Alphaproteobacteria bacterium]